MRCNLIMTSLSLSVFLAHSRKTDFHVYVAANKEGSHLEIRSLNLAHNHDIGKELFKYVPQQRRLLLALKMKANSLLEVKAFPRQTKSEESVMQEDLAPPTTNEGSVTQQNDPVRPAPCITSSRTCADVHISDALHSGNIKTGTVMALTVQGLAQTMLRKKTVLLL